MSERLTDQQLQILWEQWQPAAIEIQTLRARVTELEAACRSAGLCMSCLYGAPDPIGCTDCLGTGWDGGSPYDQIKVLEARVAELEAGG